MEFGQNQGRCGKHEMSAIARPLAGRYFETGIPGADLKIQLSLDVIVRLGLGVMEGFKLVPRRGLEVGGLLLGRVEQDCVIIDEQQVRHESSARLLLHVSQPTRHCHEQDGLCDSGIRHCRNSEGDLG